MNQDEFNEMLRTALSEHLQIEVDTQYGWDLNTIKIEVRFMGSLISWDTFNVPDK